MSDDELDQNQVEKLLEAMEGVDPDTGEVDQAGRPVQDAEATTQSPSAPVAQPGDAVGTGGDKASPFHHGVAAGTRINAYDFKRPERVGKEQMRAMHSLHEQIARNFGATVSGMLRTMIEVKLLSVDQLTYSEFVFSLENPSCFNVLQPAPLEGSWILDISPSLAYAVIDRMLGGEPTPGETIRRSLTEIETRLIRRIVEAFLTQVQNAWVNVVDLAVSIEAMESNPQLVQIVPPNEVVVLVGFELLLGKNRGMMNLCIPFNTIERFNAKLSGNGWVGYGRGEATPETQSAIGNRLSDASVDLIATLARGKISTRELMDLAIGDVIATDQSSESTIELSVCDVPKFGVRPGAYKGKKAVHVREVR